MGAGVMPGERLGGLLHVRHSTLVVAVTGPELEPAQRARTRHGDIRLVQHSIHPQADPHIGSQTEDP